jgi:hypothetical protein
MSKKKKVKVKPYKKRTAKPKSKLPMLYIGIGAALVVVVAVWFIVNNQKDSSVTESELTGAPPKLEVDKELIDFGDVPFNEFVTARFKVSNTGGQPLHFTQNPYVEIVEGC